MQTPPVPGPLLSICQARCPDDSDRRGLKYLPKPPATSLDNLGTVCARRVDRMAWASC